MSIIVYNACATEIYLLPVGQGFDRLVPDLNPLLCVQSKAQEAPLQMHKHHFVVSVFLSVSSSISHCEKCFLFHVDAKQLNLYDGHAWLKIHENSSLVIYESPKRNKQIRKLTNFFNRK